MNRLDHGRERLSPATAASVNRAYARLLRALGREGADIHRRVALGRHLMDLAEAGERDEDSFVRRALRAMAAENPPAAAARRP